MNILICSATIFEVAPFRKYLENNFQNVNNQLFKNNKLNIYLSITGIGMTLTAYNLGKLLSKYKIDVAINVGIAGAIDQNFKIGDMVNVVSEEFGDVGVENLDGSFSSMHELDLIPKNEFPFRNGKLENPDKDFSSFLPKAKGLTINKVHGQSSSIAALRHRTDSQIETMEGAAFFYVCMVEKISFLQIRAISNFVEPRNRDNWNIPLAITNLNQILEELIETFGT